MNYNYFPLGYQPNYYGNPYFQQQLQNQAMMQQAQQTQQAQQMQQTQQAQMQQPIVQQNVFIPVQSEQEGRAYPVAPGNAVTLHNERQPQYYYVKAMGFNQFDQPTFDIYRMIKEESTATPENISANNENATECKDIQYALKSDLEAIWSEIQALKERTETQPEKSRAKAKKEEAE